MKDRKHNDQKKKDKQGSTKHTHKTTDRVTRTPLKPGGERRCSGRVLGKITCKRHLQKSIVNTGNLCIPFFCVITAADLLFYYSIWIHTFFRYIGIQYVRIPIGKFHSMS